MKTFADVVVSKMQSGFVRIEHAVEHENRVETHVSFMRMSEITSLSVEFVFERGSKPITYYRVVVRTRELDDRLVSGHNHAAACSVARRETYHFRDLNHAIRFAETLIE